MDYGYQPEPVEWVVSAGVFGFILGMALTGGSIVGAVIGLIALPLVSWPGLRRMGGF